MRLLKYSMPVFMAIILVSTTVYGQHPTGHHHQEMTERGNRVMGFDQSKVSHHFLLSPTGGIIEVGADNPSDLTSKNQIREHLAHIAHMFSEGNFEGPMEVHNQLPPGAPVMKELKEAIEYGYEETERGGRVIISAQESRAIDAIHDFLRFQITDHQTGDPLDLK